MVIYTTHEDPVKGESYYIRVVNSSKVLTPLGEEAMSERVTTDTKNFWSMEEALKEAYFLTHAEQMGAKAHIYGYVRGSENERLVATLMRLPHDKAEEYIRRGWERFEKPGHSRGRY
jgi:hypothetical protein